jgi:YD repeat-containing protein
LGDQNTDPAGQTPVEFVYESSSASSVSVAGSFNGWSSTANPLTKSGNTWKVTLPVGEGTHLYKFVVNGSSWIQDPNNSFRAPDGFGGYNSKLAVGPMDEAILRVQTSDGRGVDYLYTMETSGWTIYGVLTQVDYGDGTSAAYTYTLPYNRNGRPIIESANDPRYPGRAAMVSYGYQNTGVDGFIQQEKTLGGTPLITVTATNDVNRTLTWANGLVEHLAYGSLQLLSRSNSVTGARTASYFDNGYGMRSGWKNAANGETTYERTLQFGAVKKTTRPDNTSVTRTFTDENRPFFVATETDELGRTTTYTRDGSGRATRIDYPDSTYETFTYNGFGQVLAKRLRDGATNSNAYGSAGRRTSSTDGTGASTTYTYDAAGNKLTEQRADGATTTYTYTPANRVATVKDAANKTTGFTYDGLGNMLALTDAMSRTHTFTYDGAGRRKTFQYPDSSQEGYGYIHFPPS